VSQASGSSPAPKKVTVRSFAQAKERGEPVVMVTAYDALFARLVDESGVDSVLVGDSLGNVFAGLETTVPVTLDQMIYHGTAARRGTKRALLVVDLPFLTYQVSTERALLNAGRVMQETQCDAVKLEGGSPEAAETIRALVRAGIPVVGHLGFTPQSVHVLGGFRVQGRGEDAAERLLVDARRVQEAGAFSLVLELVPADVAARVTAALTIPTIGIGAGVGCDGQVLVLPDLLGLTDDFTPKFLKRYATLAETTREAVRHYAAEVRARAYPGSEHAF
jgi:3-methyl-2-oxobutanoate hydroxymethyltransferase